MYGNSHSQDTCVVGNTIHAWISLHTCSNEDIYELKGVNIANFEADLCSSGVIEYCCISNVNSL